MFSTLNMQFNVCKKEPQSWKKELGPWEVVMQSQDSTAKCIIIYVVAGYDHMVQGCQRAQSWEAMAWLQN